MPNEVASYDFDTASEALALVAASISIKGITLCKIIRIGSVIRVSYNVEPESRGFLTGAAMGIRKVNKFGYEVKYKDEEF